ncbi:hypothetical protein [Enterobacter cloacae]|uniref:hypothetical protein n=1 Tax=Enterobacter cloacae TaxID=550 RepID=UPI00296CBF52|nr:hypothetical protein [Enterobacter cloacae]MEB7116894.1 hypothetical protein [Enterobacter cloacae]HAV2175078.1 hypothetical protein [Enterobacter cloacae]
MIESAIKTAVERITGLDTYPLLLPDTVQEGATFQRISDPQVGDGLRRTGLSEVRIQISLYVVDRYTSLLQFDGALWTEWKEIVHGQLEGQPVQYVERGGIQQGKTTFPNNRIQYRLVRDFIFTVPE